MGYWVPLMHIFEIELACSSYCEGHSVTVGVRLEEHRTGGKEMTWMTKILLCLCGGLKRLWSPSSRERSAPGPSEAKVKKPRSHGMLRAGNAHCTGY